MTLGKDLLNRWSLAAHDPKHSWHEQATFAHCFDSLRRELDWNGADDLPKEQDHYLCATKDRGVLVLDWDGNSWDHPDDALADWEYWNAQPTHWLPLPKMPERK